MNNEIQVDVEAVQDFLRLEKQYESRIKILVAQYEAVVKRLSFTRDAFEEIKLRFIKAAAFFIDEEYSGVFADGKGGFVLVTVLKAGPHGHKSNLLSIKEVKQ